MLGRLDDSIRLCSEFLESRKSADGLWHDFKTSAGAGVDWVSGFIGYAVSHAAIPNRDEILLSTFRTLLRRQRTYGGWAYNRWVPCDCDSTAWVLLALSNSLDLRPLVIRRAIDFMIRHQERSSGGFATFILSEKLRKLIAAPNIEEIQGWLSPHTCVTAVAVQCLLTYGMAPENEIIQNGLKYLINQRSPLGTWNSYWWKGYAYGTYNALRAIMLCHKPFYSEYQETVRNLAGQQLQDGGWNDASDGGEGQAFPTAFVILTLLLSPEEYTLNIVKRGIEWLLKNQLRDGSWKSFPILQVPPGDTRDPSTILKWEGTKTGIVIADEGRCFTSAAVLWALSQCRMMLNSKANTS